MRTFVAVELPAPVQHIIEKQQQQIDKRLRAQGQERSVRWIPAAKAHLTVRFLGETSPTQRVQILEGINRLSQSWRPLTLRLEGVGCFPGFRQPRVIWLGVGGDVERLSTLQGHIEALARQSGFEPEQRAYSPHLTIGRAARRADRGSLQQVGEVVRNYATDGSATADSPADTSFVVDHLVHMQSRLQPSGSIYTPLATFSLGSPPSQ